MESMVRPLAFDSDRAVLTVRLTSDGHREWLDASGKIALIFFEHGKWWVRESNRHSRIECSGELEALDTFNARLAEIKRSGVAQAEVNYLMEG